jgi:hypothetical protein
MANTSSKTSSTKKITSSLAPGVTKNANGTVTYSGKGGTTTLNSKGQTVSSTPTSPYGSYSPSGNSVAPTTTPTKTTTTTGAGGTPESGSYSTGGGVGIVKKGENASTIAQSLGQTSAQFLANNPTWAAKGTPVNGQNKDWTGLTGNIQVGQKYNTTTLSNLNKINEVPKIIQKTDGLANDSGITTDTASGTSTYADGSVVEPPKEPTVAPKSGITEVGGYFGSEYYAPGAEIPTIGGKPVNLTENSPEHNQIIEGLNNLRSQSDAITSSGIANIQQQFAGLIQQQNQQNSAMQGQTQNALLMGGATGQGSSAQFAPISSIGILQSQINYGIQQITDLNVKEQNQILQAKQAGFDRNYQLQDQMNTEADYVRKEKHAAVLKLSEDIASAKKDADEKFYDRVTKPIQDISLEAAKNGAPPEIQSAIASAKNPNDAMNAAGMYLQSASGTMGEYLQYKKDMMAKGLTPLAYMDFQAKQDAAASKLKSSEAYNSAYNSAAGRAAAEKKYGVGDFASSGTGTKAEKPATQAQFTAAGFANRVVQSKDLIDANTQDLTKLGTKNYLVEKNLPNFLQSPLVQKELQAERNFVNAVLRRESGAAISPTEFDSAAKQYFPQPGDSQAVLAQKKANRDLTAQNLINEGGVAYKETVLVPKIAQDKVNQYVSQNPKQAETVAKLYEVPGATDEDIYAYLKANNLIQ